MSIKDKENSAVQTHINILQNIISRMANNSANAKTWCITIVSAIIALLFDKNKTGLAYIALIPVAMFFFLDCYYLGLERFFRKQYNVFVVNLDGDSFQYAMVYKLIGPAGFFANLKNTIGGVFSFSTIPYYGIIVVLVLIIPKLVNAG